MQLARSGESSVLSATPKVSAGAFARGARRRYPRNVCSTGAEMADNVVRIETRRVRRRVPGLGEAVFRAPAAADERPLGAYHAADESGFRAFVNELIAATLESPTVNPARVDGLSERARATARVAVADACGCAHAYRRLARSGMSGDERLYRAMRARYEEQLERMRRVSVAVTDNVIRMAERTRKALIGGGTVDYLARPQRQMEQLTRVYSRSLRPDYFERIERMTRQLNDVVAPPILDQLTRHDSAVNALARSYTKIADDIARQLDAVVRPSYFGVLEKLSRQINDAVRPRHLETVTRVAEQIQQVIRPSYLERINETFEQIQSAITPAAVEQISHVAEQIQQVIRPTYLERINETFEQIQSAIRPAAVEQIARVFEQMRERLLTGLEGYASWLERNWARIYADPNNPPPIMFLLAALPMAVGLPILRALKATDEPLLARLEDALAETSLVGALQQAVQQNPDLDSVSKQYLVTALEAVREQRYVAAAPPLAWGLERAFKELARARGIIDSNNKFRAPHKKKKKKAKKVEDLFAPLGLDKLYARFLHAWVFGEFGNLARHGDLPEPEHRRWVLRAVVALVGWFEYCAADEAPMDALVARLELPRGERDADTA
jgi:hypothetical protein